MPPTPQDLLGADTYEALLEETAARLRGGEDPRKVADQLLTQLTTALEENRRRRLKEAQAEGIRAAREKGVQLGRRPRSAPAAFPNALRLLEEGSISVAAAAKLCGSSVKTFYRWKQEYEHGGPG